MTQPFFLLRLNVTESVLASSIPWERALWLLYCWLTSCQLCREQKAEHLLPDPAVLKEAQTSPPFLGMAFFWLSFHQANVALANNQVDSEFSRTMCHFEIGANWISD